MKSSSIFFPGRFQQKIKFKLFLTIFFTSLTLLMTESSQAIENTPIEVQQQKTSDSLSIKFLPAKFHHLNTKAPNSIQEVKNGNTQKLDFVIKKEELTVTINKTEDCFLNYKIYICDDANTYCLPKEGTYQCQGNKISETQVKKNNTTETNKNISSKSDLFIINDPNLALQKAKVENKALLIDFFGTWCPPCNVLDETVFSDPKFKEYQNKMVFLKLDADLPVSWDLKAKFDIKGYPTVVFTTPNNDEIYRILDATTPHNFFKKMDYVVKNKNHSIKDIISSYNINKTPQTAWKLMEAYINQEDYNAAYQLIPITLKKTALSAKEQDQIQYIQLKFSLAQSNKENKVQFIDFIKNSIENNPKEETFLDKLNILDGIADDLKDENLNKWVALQTLKITNDLLSSKLAADAFISKSDIYFLRADAFEKLGSKTESQFVYKMAAKEMEQQIKKYKLDLKTNRGFNLSRVYAIAKSGDNTAADALYQDLIKAYPEEFTFYYNHAGLLKDLKKNEEALKQAQKALEYSYGDNKLRAAFLTASLMKELSKTAESKKLVEDVLQSFSLPENKSIRTHRYYKKLVELKESLSK